MGKWLQKRLDGGKLEIAEYRITETIDGSRHISLACPCCGDVFALDTSAYDIAGNGVVSPIWVCPAEHCPGSDYLLFESWGE